MSPSTRSPSHAARTVSSVLAPHRTRLNADARAFTLASLKLARATADGKEDFNAPSAQATAALAALSRWQRAVHGAQTSVRALPAHTAGKALALKWLSTLDGALGLIRQAMSLTDPKQAGDAAKRARKGLDEAHGLAVRLDRVIA